MPVYVTESELQPVLPLEGSFASKFIDFAGKLGDSPLAYHYVNALGLLAAVSPHNLMIEDIVGGTHYANFWGMVVGRPGVEHKTSALKIATGVLNAVAPQRVGSVIGSYEGIVRMLAPPNSTRLAPLFEMGHFLNASAGTGYQDKIKPFLTDIYDCQPYDRPLSNKPMRIPNPRLSILAAVNHDLLQTHATPSDWGGGFMSRWFVLNSITERDDPEEGPTKTEAAELRSHLLGLMNDPVGRCGGLTVEGNAFWRAWNRQMKKKMEEALTGAQASIHGRIGLHAVKIALLLAFDYGTARTKDEWFLDEDLLWIGTQLADMHHRCMKDLAQAAQPTNFMRERFQVLQVVEGALQRQDPYMSFAEILRSTSMGKRRLAEVLDSLLTEETTITFEMRGGAQWFAMHAAQLPEAVPDNVVNLHEMMSPEMNRLMAAAQGREIDFEDAGEEG